MAQFMIISIIVLFLLWLGSFFIFWIQIGILTKMIITLERAIDYALLKSDVYMCFREGNKEELEKKESEIREQLNTLKDRVKKDFDI